MSWLIGSMSTFLDGAFFAHALIEEPGLRIERGAEPVGRAVIVRIDQCSFRARDCRRIEDRTTSLIEPASPILPRKLLAHEKLADQPVQNIVKAVPVGEQH